MTFRWVKLFVCKACQENTQTRLPEINLAATISNPP